MRRPSDTTTERRRPSDATTKRRDDNRATTERRDGNRATTDRATTTERGATTTEPDDDRRRRRHIPSAFHSEGSMKIPSIPSIFFVLFFFFPLFVHNPSAFRLEVPSKLPRSPPKPRNVPRSPFTLRRRSCPVAQAPFSTRGLREAEEQALPGRAWSPRSVRATSPFGLARRGKDATDPVKTKGFFRRRTTLSKLLVCALTRATQRRRRRLGGCGAAVARTPTR